ncbi:helix-turn-helix transcriptional regulator [Azospirillum lipoferum]|uniref:Transcriptional regulator, XRE family n=1 Tax=Azospirillum lipoferum (strain 4B) TaxID=862719 RepID=G7Z5G0_AZOL4
MITPKHIKAARVLLDWKQSDLAAAAGISETALANIERGATDPRVSTMNSIQQALEAVGIEFFNGGEPGVRLRKIKG